MLNNFHEFHSKWLVIIWQINLNSKKEGQMGKEERGKNATKDS